MDLDTYAEWARLELAWLDNLLRREGVEALRQSYHRLGDSGIRRILRDHAGDIRDYLTTQKNRRGPLLRRFAVGLERHGFLLAASYQARCGATLLELACRYGMSAGSGQARSSLLVQASATAQELHDDFPTLWPFHEDPPSANDDDCPEG